MKRRILVVTNGPLCRNPRPLKEARTLGAAGYEVTAITVRNHAPSEALDREILHDAPFRRETVDMIPGYSAGPGRLLLRRARLWAARKAAGRLNWQTIQSLGPADPLLSLVRSVPADLTIVHNEVPHWIGTRLIAAGRRVAADIEDWHSEDLLPADRASRPLVMIRQVEQILLRKAAYTSTTSEALAGALHGRYGGNRPHVITNSFPLQPDPRSGVPGEPPAFFWFSQTIGLGRGLEAFLETWKLTERPSRLALLGEAGSDFKRRLLDRLPPAWQERVRFLSLVPPDKLPGVIAEHDIGLALECGDIRNRDLTITNKILQYFNAGLAVVASATAGQREALENAPGAGILADLSDGPTLAAQLDALLGGPDRLRTMQEASRRAAESRYCWEREEPRLLECVERAIGSTPS